MVKLLSAVSREIKKEVLESKDLSNFALRDQVVNYSWMLPSKFNLAMIDAALGMKPQSKRVLEIGCGSGLIGKYLIQKGYYWRGMRANTYACDDISFIDNDHLITLLDPSKNIISELENKINLKMFDTVMMIWPPYATSLATDTWKLYQAMNNFNKLIYVGEKTGNVNGDENWRSILETHDDEFIKIKIQTWNYIHDKLYVHIKNKGVKK